MEPTDEQREKWELQAIKQSQSRLNARPISSVMRRLLSSKDYGAIQSTQSLVDTWPKIVGDKLAAATRLGKISRGALLVEANSSQALQELHFQQTTILKRLQAELPEQKIQRLSLRMATF
jgi:hypothetical protein